MFDSYRDSFLTFYNTNAPFNLSHMKRQGKGKMKKEQQTVFVYFDFEAQQDTGNHIANLVCAETDQNDVQFTFKGKDCIQEFLQRVHSIASLTPNCSRGKQR